MNFCNNNEVEFCWATSSVSVPVVAERVKEMTAATKPTIPVETATTYTLQCTDKLNNSHKPVGDWISAPRLVEISLPWQQGSAPQQFAWFHWIGHPRKPPGRCKHLRSICHTSRLIGDFVQILGSKFLALGGLNLLLLLTPKFDTLILYPKMHCWLSLVKSV